MLLALRICFQVAELVNIRLRVAVPVAYLGVIRSQMEGAFSRILQSGIGLAIWSQ